MTKTFKNPKILALNMELELKSEKDNAEVRLSDPAKYQELSTRSGTSFTKSSTSASPRGEHHSR